MPPSTPSLVAIGGTYQGAGSVLEPTTLLPAMPTGYAVGDTLMGYTVCRSPTPTVAIPAGWTQILNVTGANGRLVLFAKVATSTSEAVPSIVWSGLVVGTSGSGVVAALAAFRDLDTSNLAAMAEIVGSAVDGAASATVSAGGAAMTTTADNDLILSLSIWLDNAFTTFVQPAGFTILHASGSSSGLDQTLAWAYRVKTPAGAVAAANWAITGATPFASTGVMVALKAVVVGAGPTYNDTPTGTLSLSGTRVESSPRKGTIALTGSCVDSFVPRIWYKDVVLATPGLVSYWRLGETDSTAVDISDNANDGVASSITRAVPGLLTNDPDKASQSGGAQGSHIQFAPTGNMNVGAQLTAEFWCEPTSLGNLTYPFGKAIVGESWSIRNRPDGRWEFVVIDVNSVTTTILVSAPAAEVGKRQHIVMTYDVTAGMMKAYINGMEIGTQSRHPNANILVTPSSSMRLFNANGSTTGFAGVIDEASFYNVALTPEQILQHYQAGSGVVIRIGTMRLSGSCVESYTKPPYQPSGSIGLSGSCADAFSIILSWGGPVRELPPLRHHVDAIAPNGRHYRWAKDEPRAENVFNGLRWSSTMPGGHENLDCILPRMPGVDYADLERFTTVRVINAGGAVVGEFRLERTPQTSGEQMSISPSAVGWQAHLSDNKNVNIIFIDREHGGWVSADSLRRLALLALLRDPIDHRSTQAEDGLPSLILGQQGAWARRFDCEMYYHMPGSDVVSRVKFDFTASKPIADMGYTNWFGEVSVVSARDITKPVIADDRTYTQLTADWLTTGSDSVNSDASAVALANRKAAMVSAYYSTGPAGSDNGQYDIFLRQPRVFGNHGIAIRGVEYNGTPPGYADRTHEGFLASDMIAFAVGKWAPLLNINSDSIHPTNFIIPQAAFRDTTVSEIVNQTTRFGLEDWGVWNNRTLHLNRRNESPFSRKWRARIGPAKLEETGKQADRLWESIIVEFTDANGSTQTVGPPGSGADVEDSQLKDTDPDNPANKLGMVRRDKLVMGGSTVKGAIEVGRRFLEEQKLIDRSGRATLVGHVEDNHGILFPYSEVKAGDAITFVDSRDFSYRRIVKADHDDSAKSVTLDLDAPPEGLQAVLERLQVVLVPLGL